MAHLVINSSSSQCSECRGNASPHDTHHIQGGLKSGWDEGSSLNNNNGCGVEWEYALVPYPVNLETAEWLKERFSQIIIRFALIN